VGIGARKGRTIQPPRQPTLLDIAGRYHGGTSSILLGGEEQLDPRHSHQQQQGPMIRWGGEQSSRPEMTPRRGYGNGHNHGDVDGNYCICIIRNVDATEI
jgi:hypothetical protein